MDIPLEDQLQHLQHQALNHLRKAKLILNRYSRGAESMVTYQIEKSLAKTYVKEIVYLKQKYRRY